MEYYGIIEDRLGYYGYIKVMLWNIYAKDKFSLAERGRPHQYQGDDLDTYLKRCHCKALNCCDPIAEDVLVDVFPHKMIDDYWSYLKICLLLLSSIDGIHERSNKFVRKTLKYSLLIKSAAKKKSIVVV